MVAKQREGAINAAASVAQQQQSLAGTTSTFVPNGATWQQQNLPVTSTSSTSTLTRFRSKLLPSSWSKTSTTAEGAATTPNEQQVLEIGNNLLPPAYERVALKKPGSFTLFFIIKQSN